MSMSPKLLRPKRSSSSMPWYLTSGVSASDVLGAWKPIGAASQEDSYINLTGGGNLTAPVAPTWNAEGGWYFSGTEYLLTPSLSLHQDMTVIVMYSGAGHYPTNTVCGVNGIDAFGGIIALSLYRSGVDYIYGVIGRDTGGYTLVDKTIPSGVVGFTKNGLYIHGDDFYEANGSEELSGEVSIGIGTIMSEGVPIDFYTGNIKAIAIYNKVLTAEQIDTISSAMAAFETVQDGIFVATNGSDTTGDGTYSAPYATIGKAITGISAGSTVYLRGGTYVIDTTNIDCDGAPDNFVVVRSYPGESVILDGEYNAPNNTYTFLVTISGDYVRLQDVDIKHSSGGLLILTGSHSEAININGDGSYESGIIGMGDYVVIDGCSMTDNGNHYGQDGQATWGGAIAIADGEGSVIKNCESHDNTGEGLAIYGDGYDCTIEKSKSFDNLSYQCYLDSVSGCTVDSNHIFCTTESNVRGIVVGNERSQTVNGNTIINNLVSHCFVNLEISSDGLDEVTDITIEGNTFDSSWAVEGAELAGYVMGVYIKPTIITGTFRNNIVRETEAQRKPITVLNAGMTFENNCWSEDVPVVCQDAGDVVGDPLLAETDGYDNPLYYKLQTGSPCIGAGATPSLATVDYNGVTRGSPPDMGAIEY